MANLIGTDAKNLTPAPEGFGNNHIINTPQGIFVSYIDNSNLIRLYTSTDSGTTWQLLYTSNVTASVDTWAMGRDSNGYPLIFFLSYSSGVTYNVMCISKHSGVYLTNSLGVTVNHNINKASIFCIKNSSNNSQVVVVTTRHNSFHPNYGTGDLADITKITSIDYFNTDISSYLACSALVAQIYGCPIFINDEVRFFALCTSGTYKVRICGSTLTSSSIFSIASLFTNQFVPTAVKSIFANNTCYDVFVKDGILYIYANNTLLTSSTTEVISGMLDIGITSANELFILYSKSDNSLYYKVLSGSSLSTETLYTTNAIAPSVEYFTSDTLLNLTYLQV